MRRFITKQVKLPRTRLINQVKSQKAKLVKFQEDPDLYNFLLQEFNTFQNNYKSTSRVNRNKEQD